MYEQCCVHGLSSAGRRLRQQAGHLSEHGRGFGAGGMAEEHLEETS